MTILAVNAGSSSLKFALHPYAGGDVRRALVSGNIEGLEPKGKPVMRWRSAGETQCIELRASDDPFLDALASLRALLTDKLTFASPRAIAHRVVHGGRDYAGSVIVDDKVIARLQALSSLAPLHQPHNIAGIRAFAAAFPDVPQVACFDTAFHAGAPVLHQQFALPRELTDLGVRRYGFHGLSYQYIIGELQARTPRAAGRVLMAHLGNGASLCAALEGRGIASTMGFSALDGLMMGTRSGSLDPGVLLWLLEQGWEHARIQDLLYKRSGLLGVSGISADMRTLRDAAAGGSVDAQQAIALFTHRVVRESGAMLACLQGADVIAFSGGIGEHNAMLRAEIGAALGWTGLAIDDARNAAATGDDARPIHADGSRIEAWVIPTDEGRVAAREAAALLGTPEDS